MYEVQKVECFVSHNLKSCSAINILKCILKESKNKVRACVCVCVRARAHLSAHRNHSLCVLGLSAELGVLHSLSVHLKLCQRLMVTKQLR